MGIGLSFQLNKVSRLIRNQGTEFTFYHKEKNEFGEGKKDMSSAFSFKGIYHEVNSQVQFETSEGTVTRTKPQPRIMCMPDDGLKVLSGDFVSYKGTDYKVVEAVDPLKFDVCSDISLEVIQNG